MASQTDETEENKALSQYQLGSIVWPIRMPKDQASYLDPIANHIRTRFNELDPNKYRRELNDFGSLRNVALSTLTEDSLRDNYSLKTLKKYYCQLASMLARFKGCEAEFSWRDSFGRGSNDGNLEFELNNIMYNIAVIHNELGSKIPRTSEELAREACTHFRSALWWVTELRDNRAGFKPKEMGHDLLTFFHHVLRAQSQECVLSRALKAGLSPAIVSKISAQIASDYEVATKLAHSPLYTNPLKDIMSGASMFNTWRATVEFKNNHFNSMTQALLGVSLRDDSKDEVGQRIARLRVSKQYSEASKKFIPDTVNSQVTKSAHEQLFIFVTKKLDKAEKYNDGVYHAPIPAKEQLSQPEGELIIKPEAFSISTFSDFKDLFSGLVTLETVQVNSIYSQKKDDLSREVRSKVEKQDGELAQMMSTLNFERRSLRLEPFETPDELIEICAELSTKPNIVDDVLTRLEEIDDKSEEIQQLLDAAQELLKKQSNAQLNEELNKFRATHLEALKTTQTLHKQLNPELQQKIQLLATTNDPSELVPKGLVAANQEEAIKRLEKLLDKVDAMKAQRAGLLAELRRSIDQDDVLKHVVAASSEQELKKVFDKEIQKHNKYLEPLMSNLKLQNELLDDLEKANAQYGQVKLNHRAQRTTLAATVESFRKVHSQFKTLSEGIDQGLNYHNKMVELVRKFYAKVQAAASLNDLLN